MEFCGYLEKRREGIKNVSDERFEDFKKYISLLQDYSKILQNYSKEIDKIINNKNYDRNYPIFKLTKDLLIRLSNMKKDYIVKLNFLIETRNLLNEEFKKKEQERSKKLFEVESNLLSLFSKFEKNFGNYKEKVKEVEKVIGSYYNDSKKISYEEEEEYKETIARMIGEGKDCEKKYIDSINQYNAETKKYNEISEKILEEYKKDDDEIIKNIKEFANSFFKYEYERRADERSSINNNMKIFENYSFDKSTNGNELFIPIKAFELRFQPYQSQNLINLEERIKLGYFNDIITHNKIKLMKENFKGVAENYDIKKEEEKVKLTSACIKIVDKNAEITDDQLRKLFSMLNKKESRLTFMSFLNVKRAEGKLKLYKKPFEILGYILKYMIEKVKDDHDYEIARYCLIMSQTYCFENSKTKKKYFLTRYIEDNDLFKTKKAWEILTEMLMVPEIERFTKEGSKRDTEEEKQQKISNIAFSKLLSICHNMRELRVDQKVMNELLEDMTQKYKLDKELKEQIGATLINVEYEEYSPFIPEKDLDDGGVPCSSKNIEKIYKEALYQSRHQEVETKINESGKIVIDPEYCGN